MAPEASLRPAGQSALGAVGPGALMMPPMADRAERILIVRLSAIGDVLHTLPVLCALRDARPAAHLAWMVEGRTVDLLAGHPALDEVIAIRRRWLKSPRAVLDLWRRVQGRFDVAIDVQGLSKSAVAARLSGARQRIGMAAPDGREISPWLNNARVRPTATHVVDRNLELLAPLGITPLRVRFDLPEARSRRPPRRPDDRPGGGDIAVGPHQSRSRLAVEAVAGRTFCRRCQVSGTRARLSEPGGLGRRSRGSLGAADRGRFRRLGAVGPGHHFDRTGGAGPAGRTLRQL